MVILNLIGEISVTFRSGSVVAVLSGCLAHELVMFTGTICLMDSAKLMSKFLSSVW